MRAATAFVTSVLLVGASSPLRSETIVDTGAGLFGPGSSVYGNSSGNGGPAFSAGKFSVLSGRTISRAEGYVFIGTGGDLTIKLYEGLRGLPSEALFSTVVTIAPERFSTWGWLGSSNLDWAIPAGDYWLSFEASPDSSFVGTVLGNAPRPAIAYANYYDRQWHPYVELSQLPGAGYFGFRVQASDASPVPELPSWVLLISGFALIGTAARRQTGCRALTTLGQGEA
jgi:hypothetical protein